MGGCDFFSGIESRTTRLISEVKGTDVDLECMLKYNTSHRT